MEALAFIKKYFGVFSPHFENTIIEEAEEFKISCTNDSSYVFYILNKKTGEQGDTLQGSYLSMPKPLEGNNDSFFYISDKFGCLFK